MFLLVKSTSKTHDARTVILKASSIYYINCFSSTVNGKIIYFVSAQADVDGRRAVAAHDTLEDAKTYLVDVLYTCGETLDKAKVKSENTDFEHDGEERRDEKRHAKKELDEKSEKYMKKFEKFLEAL